MTKVLTRLIALSHVHQVLNQLGLSYIWEQGYRNSMALNKLVKQRMYDMYTQNWQATLNIAS